MIHKSLYIILVMQCISSAINCCSCIPIGRTFLENLNYEYILKVKVINHFNFKSSKVTDFVGISNNITKLEIQKSYNSNVEIDTIYFANYSSASCGISLNHYKENSELLIKATNDKSVDSPEFLTYKFWDQINEELHNLDSLHIQFLNSNKLISGGECDYSILEIKDDEVKGNLTRNISDNLVKVKKALNFISNKIGDWFYNKFNSNIYQTMNLNTFEKKLKRGIGNITRN